MPKRGSPCDLGRLAEPGRNLPGQKRLQKVPEPLSCTLNTCRLSGHATSRQPCNRCPVGSPLLSPFARGSRRGFLSPVGIWGEKTETPIIETPPSPRRGWATRPASRRTWGRAVGRRLTLKEAGRSSRGSRDGYSCEGRRGSAQEPALRPRPDRRRAIEGRAFHRARPLARFRRLHLRSAGRQARTAALAGVPPAEGPGDPGEEGDAVAISPQ